MIVYTGNCYGDDIEEVRKRDMGILVCTSTKPSADKKWHDLPCAQDNGAFRAWERGFQFNEKAFLSQLDACWEANLTLNWIVCPDLVARGMESLTYSLTWSDRLPGARLAFAVQDGMTPVRLAKERLERRFCCLFIGGTVEWKWATAEQWAQFAKERGMQLHIGRCGRLEYLRRAEALGADSCDSASFVRNNSWHIIDEWRHPNADLFQAP